MTIKDDLSLFEAAVERPNPYEGYSLLENPFPGYGETREDVCTDQGEIKRAFVSLLRDFGPQAKRLRIDGGSGAGKTNILRYFERLTNEARQQRLIKTIYPIYVFAPSDSYFAVHGQVVERLAEFFLGDLVAALRAEPSRVETLSMEVKPAAELLSAMKLVVNPGRLIDIYEERRRDAFVSWLKGRKLPAQDKRLLGESVSDINSASLAIRFLDGFLQVLKGLGLCDGIALLLDEFEEIFEALSRARQSQYAQDIRHLFDTLQESALFVIATIPEPRDLAQYPAIVRRLGNPLRLDPIGSVDTAMAYVRDYLRFGRERYFRVREAPLDQSIADSLAPLTQEAIQQEYQALESEAKRGGLDVLPGYFLPRMRHRMQELVEGSQ